MKKIMWTVALVSFLFVGFGLMAHAEMAREGSTSQETYFVGTFDSLPMGKEYVQLPIELAQQPC